MQEEKQISPSKLDPKQIIPRLEKLQARSNQCFNRVIHSIDRMINKIQECQNSMQDQNQTQQQRRQQLQKLQKGLIDIKPLKNVREQFNNFYKRLSAFGKEITVQELETMKLPVDIMIEQYNQIICQALSEHFMRQGKWKSAQALSTSQQKYQIFKQCASLKQKILNDQFEQPIKWTESQKLYETYDNLLEYQLKKLKLLKILKNGMHEQAIQYYSKQMQKFVQKRENQLNKLIGYILFSTQQFWKGSRQMPQRYNFFQKQNKHNIAQVFSHTYLQHYGINVFDSISICHKVGTKHKRQFIKKFNMITQQQKMKSCLPFSITLQDKYKYHSQFSCPVSKQLLSSKQGTVLFKCGHVISDAAYNKIVQNRGGIRRKLKCPVCQQQQKVQQILPVQF